MLPNKIAQIVSFALTIWYDRVTNSVVTNIYWTIYLISHNSPFVNSTASTYILQFRKFEKPTQYVSCVGMQITKRLERYCGLIAGPLNMFNFHGYHFANRPRPRLSDRQINKLIFFYTLGGTCGFLQIGSKQKAHSSRSSDKYGLYPDFFIDINIVFSWT